MADEILVGTPTFSPEDLREITNEVKGVLKSGWLTSGPKTAELERAFARHVGTKNAVALNSCTAALHSILLSLGVGQGDEVIAPTNTFIATPNAAVYVGAKPVLVDSDEDTFNISPARIREAITDRTKAIIVVHLAGNPCDMTEVLEIAEERHIPVVEDAAHAHSSTYRRQKCGSIGRAGAFSLYPTKVITSAEGGVVTTNDGALADKVRKIRNHGRAGFGPLANTEIGYNFRMSDIHACIGLSQFSHIRSFVRRRNEIARRYARGFRRLGWVVPQVVREGNVSTFYVYVCMLGKDAPLTQGELAQRLKEAGIGTTVTYHPVHLQPIYQSLFGYRKGDFPVAERIGESSICFPMHNSLTDGDVDRVIEAVSKAARG